EEPQESPPGCRADRSGERVHQRRHDQHGKSGPSLRRGQVERDRPVPRSGGTVELLSPGVGNLPPREEKAGDQLVSLCRTADGCDPIPDPFVVWKRMESVAEGIAQFGGAVFAAEITLRRCNGCRRVEEIKRCNGEEQVLTKRAR